MTTRAAHIARREIARRYPRLYQRLKAKFRSQMEEA